MGIKVVPATPEVEAAYQAVIEAMQPYADAIGPDGMLAVTSKLVGKLLATLDPKRYTSDSAMAIVTANIEAGNAEMVTELMMQKMSPP